MKRELRSSPQPVLAAAGVSRRPTGMPITPAMVFVQGAKRSRLPVPRSISGDRYRDKGSRATARALETRAVAKAGVDRPTQAVGLIAKRETVALALDTGGGIDWFAPA
jgi:hypothetical protein